MKLSDFRIGMLVRDIVEPHIGIGQVINVLIDEVVVRYPDCRCKNDEDRIYYYDKKIISDLQIASLSYEGILCDIIKL